MKEEFVALLYLQMILPFELFVISMLVDITYYLIFDPTETKLMFSHK